MTGWRVVTIGKCCKVIAGQSPESLFYNKDGKGLPFYQGKKDFGDMFVSPPKVWTEQVTKIAEADDVLMSVRAPVGPVNIATNSICIGRGLAAIRPSNEIYRNYLYYFFKCIEPTLTGTAGAVFPSINKAQIEEIQIPLPPLAIQKAIVAKLDVAFASIDTAIAAAEKNAENAKQLFQSYLSDVFEKGGEGWEEKSLPTIAKVSTGKWDANHAKEAGAYRFYTCASKYVYSDTKRFFGNCLILPGNGANVGDVYFYDGEFDAYQRTYVISDITINPHFLYHHMSCFWSIRNKDKQFGSATNFIKIGNFHDYTVNFPEVNTQQEIVAKISSLNSYYEAMRDNLEKRLKNYSQLKQSLLQQAFSGQLVDA